jgi:hypothetical protein
MDKITLTKKTFIRCFNHPVSMTKFDTVEDAWSALVAESQRPELIERWVVVVFSKILDRSFVTLKEAEEFVEKECPINGRIVHLREVVGV